MISDVKASTTTISIEQLPMFQQMRRNLNISCIVIFAGLDMTVAAMCRNTARHLLMS